MSIRKIAVAAAAVAAFTSVFAAEENASDQGIGAIGWTPAQIGLCAPVSYPWGFDWDLKGFGIDLLYTENVLLKGVAISGIATRSRDVMTGLVASGLCNWNDRDTYGINMTLGANCGFADNYGVDVASFSMRNVMKGLDVNLLGSYQKAFTGVQVAGLCNFTLGDFTGGDLALGLNMTKNIKGAELGGINFAHRLTGCQLGFFNIAEECPCGIQIGIINIILDNQIKVLPITNFYF